EQLQRVTILVAMQCVNPRFMTPGRNAGNGKVITVPLVFGPSGGHNVRPRELSYLRIVQFSVDEELHLDALVRRGVVHGPAGDRMRFGNRFAPAVKGRWKCVGVNEDGDCANEYGLEDRFADEQVDELRAGLLHASCRLVAATCSVKTTRASV